MAVSESSLHRPDLEMWCSMLPFATPLHIDYPPPTPPEVCLCGLAAWVKTLLKQVLCALGVCLGQL